MHDVGSQRQTIAHRADEGKTGLLADEEVDSFERRANDRISPGPFVFGLDNEMAVVNASDYKRMCVMEWAK